MKFDTVVALADRILARVQERFPELGITRPGTLCRYEHDDCVPHMLGYHVAATNEVKLMMYFEVPERARESTADDVAPKIEERVVATMVAAIETWEARRDG